MKAGEVITNDCIRSVRPGFGLAPKFLEKIMGSKVVKDARANTAVSMAYFTP
jgi:N-acetylneuraminate synthase